MKRRISLHRVWERVRTVPGLGRDVLVMVVLTAVGLVSATMLLTSQHFIPPWSDQYVFSADFAQAPAVKPEQQPKVRIAGVVVGQIVGSQVTRDGKARVQLSIDRGTPIYRNAHLVLRPVNPVNEMYVEINPGGPPAQRLNEGGVIPASQTERPRQSDEVLNHLDQRSRNAVRDLLSTADVALAHAPQTLAPGLNATDVTMQKFKPVLVSLQQRRKNIAELVTALSKISTAVGNNDGRITDLMNSSEQTLAALSDHNNQLNAAINQLPGTTDQLRNAMNGVNSLTGQLNPTLDNLQKASRNLPGALRRASGTVDQLGRTVRAGRPAVSAARPVVDDLKPIVDRARPSFNQLVPVSRDLQPDTKMITSYLDDIDAFFFNTNGAFSLSDANGGEIRGHVVVPLPDAGVLPGSHGGNNGGSHP